jgi:hypothetical protein
MSTGRFFPGIKLPENEPQYPPPSTAEVKNVWSYISTPPYVFIARCLINKTQV